MEAVVAAAADVDDAAWSVAVSAVAATEMTTAEAPTAATEATTLVPTTKAPRMAAAETAATGVTPAEAARVSAAEASTAKVAPTKTSPTKVAAPAPEMAAEGGSISGREHADRNRDGGGSEHGLECLADHDALQSIAGRPVRFGD